jgi:hypothetical protein
MDNYLQNNKPEKGPYDRSIRVVFIFFLITLVLWTIPLAWMLALIVSTTFVLVLVVLYIARFLKFKNSVSKEVNSDRKLQILLWGLFLVLQLSIIVFEFYRQWSEFRIT